MAQHKVFNMRENGFSLVELMVGLVIGLFATLVIMQVFSVFEGQKRTTSGSADAQTNGTIALMQLQRHLQTAGYGMPMPVDPENNILRCTSQAAADVFPVRIIDGDNGDAGDTIISRYSTSAIGGAVPIEVVGGISTLGEGLLVSNNIGCDSDREILNVDDYNTKYQDLTDAAEDKLSQPENRVMIIRQDQCGTAVIAKQPTNTGSGAPSVEDLSYIRLVANPAGLTPESGDQLSCMGGYNAKTLDIDAEKNELRINEKPFASGVVSMQAQYGISNQAGLNGPVVWVDAIGIWAAPDFAVRNRIKAVRVAIALRNGLKEKVPVTDSSDLLWTANDGSTLTLSVAHLTDWARYRYRVFGTTVPLRNMIWSREAVE